MGSPTHRITICTSCKHKGTLCRPGYELIAQLRAAIFAGGDAISEEFVVSGVAYMAGCDRPCTVAYHGTRNATHLFGDIDPGDDIDDLVVFARQYAVEREAWSSSVGRSENPRNCTLARLPAAIIALEDSEVRLS